ncbi:hypothetical protein TraAM80_03511 [Trypanosoma rangeli]|uniref:Transmembrane protein n=1 Tax=Trypanosoma rangeli TaxID=5698 RepID=A0A3R7MK10_TRYRA|nr:uncharacterized protein TraAM80_03511 [Trypanosoma rangeli]RNF07218.1 hypothetical protein TraAM80_03511 [Trypanosoma rangeli]|eukprot:RNF07218.1 hypothetical protein TraAM80_03511 [Trypanosoma rangeli]
MRNDLSSREASVPAGDSAAEPFLPFLLSYSPGSGDLLRGCMHEDKEEYAEDGRGSDEGSSRGSRTSSVVNLDQIAAQMYVRVEDLLRALQSSSGSSGDTASEACRWSQCAVAGSTGSDGGGDGGNGTGAHAERDNEASSGGSKSGGSEHAAFDVLRRHLSKEALSRTQLLSYAVEDTAAGGWEREQQLREESEVEAAPIVFLSESNNRGSGSHFSRIFSAESSLHGNAPTSVGSSSPLLPPRRIRFGSRIVTNVWVYSIDNEVYLGLRFRQHWSSWAALLCGFLLESAFDVHLRWFSNVGGATTQDTIPIAHWVYTYRMFFSVVYSVAWLICSTRRDGVGGFMTVVAEPRSVFVKSLGVTLASSSCFSLATAAMVLTNEMSGSSLFFTATVLHCLWILLYRVSRAQIVFLVETCGSFLLIIGNVLCNIDGMRLMAFKETIYGNLLMSGGSLLFATAFLLMAYGLQRGLCGTVGLTVAVGIKLFFVTLIMGMSRGYSISSDAGDSLVAGFWRANAMHTCLLAMEDLSFSLMYLYALYHLDVLSVSACFSLKVAVVPVVAHFVVWRGAESVPPIVRARWGPLLFVGIGVVAVAAALVTYFASVRRRFVARRLFHLRGLRRVPDPYRKKTRRGRHELPPRPRASLPPEA